jgi:copper chaperone
MKTQVLKVEGVMCANCVQAVSAAAGGLGGVASVSVSPDFSDVTVVYEENGASLEQIVEAIESVPGKSFRVTERGGERA